MTTTERSFTTPATETEHRRKLPDHWERYEFATDRVAGTRVLDVACGCGYGSALLAKGGAREVTGADLSTEAIDWARKYYGDRAQFAAVGEGGWTFPPNTFDTVVSLETLEHVRDARAFLGEIARVLKPGGRLVLSTPVNETANRFSPENPFHLREFSWVELEELVAELFDIQERWTQSSMASAAWHASGRGWRKPLRWAFKTFVPKRIRAMLRTAIVESAGLRAGTIALGYVPGGSVQLIVARSRSVTNR